MHSRNEDEVIRFQC